MVRTTNHNCNSSSSSTKWVLLVVGACLFVVFYFRDWYSLKYYRLPSDEVATVVALANNNNNGNDDNATTKLLQQQQQQQQQEEEEYNNTSVKKENNETSFSSSVALANATDNNNATTKLQQQQGQEDEEEEDSNNYNDDENNDNHHHLQVVALANQTEDPQQEEEYNYGPSLLRSEVQQIFHNATSQTIIVRFQPNNATERICRNPRLFGRLSGPYVTLLQWETTTSYAPAANGTSEPPSSVVVVHEIIGHYHVPTPGRYFIEVIGLLCNDLQWEASYQHVCLENPTTHRLTDDFAFIHVTNAMPHQPRPALGYWKWSHQHDDDDDDDDDDEPRHGDATQQQQQQQEEPYRPLSTRYQPQKCRTETEQNTTRCQMAMSLDRFSPYQFVYSTTTSSSSPAGKENGWFVPPEETIRAKAEQLVEQQPPWFFAGGTTTILCFVGKSHAREMAREVNSWLQQQWNLSSRVIHAKFIEAHFPRLVHTRKILRNQCRQTVIASGQWSAGRKPPGGKYRNLPPTLFPEYEQEVKEMMVRLQQEPKLLKNKVHLRSIHYNALGDVKTMCPPEDWRSPPVIERYNDILQRLTLSMNISYIDTNFIIGPLWDISADFCHYRYDKVAKAEALYMLHRLFLSL